MRGLARIPLLCGVLTAFLCVAAFAEDTIYVANGGKLHFDKTSGAIMSAETSVVRVALPSEIQGAPVRSIADGAFAGCENLLSAKFANGVTSIGNGAFQGCTKLESAELPDSVTAIGDNAFSDCAALKSFRIPANAVSIGQEAFSGCAALQEITIPASVRSIGANAFDNCAKLVNVSVQEGSGFYSDLDGVLFSADKTRIVRFPQGRRDGSYAIPESVRYVGANAFRHCGKLREITIPDSVISIEDFAFFDCAALTSLAIPDSVRAIGAGAFSFSALQSVTIPDSVVSIGALAFEPCENLRDVYYAGTREQWAQLEALEQRALVPDGVTVHYESVGAGFEILSAPIANGHALKAEDLKRLKEITIPLSVRTTAQITLIVPFYDADGRFLGMGFASEAVDENTVSVTAPVTGDVSKAASVKVTLCGALRPVVRAESYSIT